MKNSIDIDYLNLLFDQANKLDPGDGLSAVRLKLLEACVKFLVALDAEGVAHDMRFTPPIVSLMEAYVEMMTLSMKSPVSDVELELCNQVNTIIGEA